MTPAKQPPARGERGELAWMSVDQLAVDEGYQRSTSTRASERLIDKISREWCWARVKPLSVSRRRDGLFVTDGQHTLKAAIKAGIRELPCYITLSSGVKVEAATLIGINRDRTNMTPLAIFHAECASGKNGTEAVQEVCAAAGVHIPRTPPQGGGKQPAHICTSPSEIKACISKHGKDTTVGALILLKEVGEDRKAWYMHRAMIGGLCRLMTSVDGDIDLARLKATLKDKQPDQWQNAMNRYREADPCQPAMAMMRVMVAHYNAGNRSKMKVA